MTTAHRMTVLVVDDDTSLRIAVARALRVAGYDVVVAADGTEALETQRASPSDVVVLDVTMHGIDGLETCRRLRARNDDVPVLMLTALDAVGNRVAGLDAGADDYLVKPFKFEELLARLRALLRRAATADSAEVLQYADLTLDPVAHEVRRGARLVELTRTEFALLEELMRHSRQVLTRGACWNGSGVTTPRWRPTRWRCSSVTCVARPSRPGSPGWCTPSAGWVTCCVTREFP